MASTHCMISKAPTPYMIQPCTVYSTLTYYSKPSMYCIILHHSNYSSCKIAFGFCFLYFISLQIAAPPTDIYIHTSRNHATFIYYYFYILVHFPSYLRSMVYFLFLSFIFNFIVEIYSFEYLEFPYFHQ